MRDAERRSLDLSGVSYRFVFEARRHTTAELRDVVRALNDDVVEGGPLAQIGLRGAGIGRDGLVVTPAGGSGPRVLAAVQEHFPGFEFELPPRIEVHEREGFASPEAAAASLLEQLEPMRRDLDQLGLT